MIFYKFWFVIIIVQSQCIPPSVPFVLTKYFSLYPYDETWKIFEGADTNGTLIHEGAGTYTDVTGFKDYDICLQINTVYTLYILNINAVSWSTTDYLSINYHGITYFATNLSFDAATHKIPQIQQFILNIVFPPGVTWKTSTTAQTGTSWTQMDFDDTTWTSLAPGSFPPITTTTRYYRYTTTFVDMNIYAIHFGIKTNSGFIVYVNGIEASRVGLPNISNSNTISLTSETDGTWKTVVIPLSLYVTSGTAFTVAIEVHSHSSQLSTTDIFDAYANPVFSSDGQVVTSGGTATCSINSMQDYPCRCVADNYDSSQYAFPHYTSTIIIALPNGSKTWFNAYQITSSPYSYQISRDPKAWKLYGSEDDGATWIFLDHVINNIFDSRRTSYVFNIPSNRKSFNKIKLHILNNNGDSYTQLAEIRTFVNSQSLVAPGLQYPSNTLNIYPNVAISAAPISSGIHTYTITPTLPTGFKFDSNNGAISGYSDTSIASQVYVISAIDGATNAATTFSMTIGVIACQQPAMAQVVITKVNKSTSNDERVAIYSEDNTQIITLTGINNGTNQVLNECQVAGRWRFVLFDDNNDGWEKGAYLDVSLKYDLTTEHRIARMYLLTGNTTTYYVNTRLDLAPKSAWRYQRGAPTDVNWKIVSFSDNTWQTLTYSPLVSITQNIILLRNTFTITSKTKMVGWELFFKSIAGCVIYVNGNEVYRHNLAAGEITTSTVATNGDTAFLWRSVSGPMTILSNGNSVTIAIALVNRGLGSYKLDFDGLFHLLGDSNVIQNIFDGTYSSTGADSGGSPNNLFDSNPYTNWITPYFYSITTKWVIIHFNNMRAIYMNKYCMISNYYSFQYDPAEWTIEGSMNANTWTTITSETNVSWEERQQRQCFFANGTTQAYIYYRIAFTKTAIIQTSNRYALAELEFLIEDTNSLVIPAFGFTPSSIVAYKGVTVPALIVSSEYYYDFTISPALPTGITMDSSNGYLNGIPTQLQLPTTYTISAKNPQDITVTTTITLSVSSCSYSNTAFVLKFNFENDAVEASWILKDSAGTVIDTRTTSINHSTQYFSFCKPKGTYSLVLSDNKNEGWGSGTYTILDIDNNVYVTGTVGAGESPKTVTVYIDQAIGSSTSWKYFTSGSVVPSGWYTISFSDYAWSTGVAGSFPVPTGTTQYYRTIFNIAAIDATSAGYEIGVKGYAGIAAYLNGQEIMRANLPSGTLSSSTLATSELSNWSFFKTSLSLIANPIHIIGINILAVELHKKETLPTTNEFSGSFIFVASGEYRVVDGVAWSDIEKTGDEGTDMLFDNNIDTSVVSGPRCVGAIYQYTFNNNRKEFINQYKITNGNTCNQRTPSSWRIEGSNDNGVTWILLDYEHQQFFTSYKQTFSYDFYSFRPYNSYRFIATECDNSAFDSLNCSGGFQLSEFGLYITNKVISCVSDGIWAPAIEGSYSFKECPIEYTGIQRRLCTAGIFGGIQRLCTAVVPRDFSYIGSPFTYHKNIPVSLPPNIVGAELTFTIDPVLPNGLTINPSTGVISGTPTTNSDITTYTINATNAGGSVSTTIMIYINLVLCTSEDNWPLTEIGQEASLPCEDPINYEGSRTRLCKVGYPGVWGSVINNCQLRMPTIIYTVPTTIGYKNVPIIPITAIITGSNLNPLTISPSLPDGLLFNSVTGLIYGTSTTTTSSPVLYTITISNPRGQSTATTTITINAFNCPIDDIWPATEVGEQASIDCEDTINYEGSRTRLCQVGDPAIWGDIINNCQLKMPSISYTTTTITGYKNIAITAIDAIITGGSLNPISISPPLPDGLLFNTENGQIYGTPTTSSSGSYVITVSNARGKDNVVINIIINIYNCIMDDIWPITEAGEQVTLPCEDPINYEGFRTRLCKLEYPAVWEDAVNNCQLKMPSISYNTNTIIGYKDDIITPAFAAITGGGLNPITISPSLPDGLIFNTQNGFIYGIPTSASSNSYTITVSNARGESTATITITIIIVNCPSDDNWPITERGITAYIECGSGQSGIQSRVCQNTGVGTASWQVADSSECYIFIVNEDPGENKVFITVPMRLEGLSESVFNTPSTIETFRILIIQSLSVYSIPSSGVKIISVSSDSSSTNGVSVSIRITANKSDEDNIKNDISILFTGIDSILLKLFKTSDDSNLNTITVFVLKNIKKEKEEKKDKKLQPHKKTPEIETVKVEKPVIL
ncbi:hypothetical protein WA158_001595 [Blastocystis sp. Blastoise]